MRVSLRAMRVHREMTQEMAAEALHVTKKTVCSWESGATTPGVDMIDPICALYRCSYDDIEWVKS